MKVGDSGVDETALTSSSSHNRVGVVETTPLVDNVTKTIGKTRTHTHIHSAHMEPMTH